MPRALRQRPRLRKDEGRPTDPSGHSAIMPLTRAEGAGLGKLEGEGTGSPADSLIPLRNLRAEAKGTLANHNAPGQGVWVDSRFGGRVA
jgi:hypothetical protein